MFKKQLLLFCLKFFYEKKIYFWILHILFFFIGNVCGVLLCNVLYTVLCLFTYLLYYLHVFYSLISILNILLAGHFRSLSSIVLFIFPLSSIYLPYLPLSVLFFCLSCTLFRTSIFIDFAKLDRNVKSLCPNFNFSFPEARTWNAIYQAVTAPNLPLLIQLKSAVQRADTSPGSFQFIC